MELGITMPRNFFGLVLLFLFCMKQSQETINDDQSHETSEFNSEQRTMLGNFTGESRSFFKKDLWRWKELMEKKRLQLYGEFFISWFRCAIGTAKFTIDRAFLIPRSFFVKENLEDIPLPEDFSNLNNTHDRWIDDAFHLKQKKKTVLSKYPLSPPTQRMKEAYLLWYNLIKKKKELRLYQDIVTVNAIADDLKKIRSSNPSKYPDDETIYRRFAASLARSYRIVDCVQHDLDLKLFENAKKYPEKKFSKVLLEMIPKWYLSHEDIVFLNVLLKAYTRKSADRIKCIVVENENHEWVAVPYEISENCGRDDINATFAEGFSTIRV